jgi:hypothetical protein
MVRRSSPVNCVVKPGSKDSLRMGKTQNNLVM